MALEIDPEFYRTLSINSHEACPDWMPPPDEAASDAYLGNGFFPTWCLDVAHRLLSRAASDGRYGFGETILTVWPPPSNFTGINAVTRVIHVDDDGGGRGDRTVTVAMPIFHVLGLLSDMGDRYWVFPERKKGGHKLAGFASRDDRGVVRILIFSHHAEDTQSRSQASFDVSLELEATGFSGPARVEQYRFDQAHNSPFELARTLRDRPALADPADPIRLAKIVHSLEGSDPIDRRNALETVHKLGSEARQSVLPIILKLAGQVQDKEAHELANAAIKTLFAPIAYSPAEVQQVQKLSECHSTSTVAEPVPHGRLKVTTRVAGNGCVFLKIEPETGRKPTGK